MRDNGSEGTEAKGGREPPARKPPTVPGTGAPQPDDVPDKTIAVASLTSVAELAALIESSPTRIIVTAFQRLGWMVTMHEGLPFDRIQVLAAQFGYTARRRDE